MIRKIMVALLMLALLASSALAQDVYMPGEAVIKAFGDAFTSGRMIKADVQIGFEADAETLGLTDEEAKKLSMVADALDDATLTLGAGKIENGLRIELGAKYGPLMPIAADAALHITADGLQVESSLIEGQRVSAAWETLLALGGMPSDQIQMVMAMRDVDVEAVLMQTVQLVAPYAQMILQAAAPYGQTIASFVSSLPTEVVANVQGSGYYPDAAKETYITVTAKDLGELLTRLANQLEADAMLSALLTSALAQQTEIPFRSAAELCAAIREGAASMTDTAHPLYVCIGADAAGAPLYLATSIAADAQNTLVVNLVRYPELEPGADAVIFEFSVLDAQEEIVDGMYAAFAYAPDATNPNVSSVACEMQIYASKQSVLSVAFEVENVENGENSYAGTQAFNMNMGDAGSVVFISETEQAMTPDGAENMRAVGSIDLYMDGTPMSVAFVNEYNASLTGDGPALVYTETANLPELGFDAVREKYTLYTEAYDPASTAALELVMLETATEADVNALAQNAMTNAQKLVGDLTAALPPEVVEMIAEAMQ